MFTTSKLTPDLIQKGAIVLRKTDFGTRSLISTSHTESKCSWCFTKGRFPK